MFNKKIAFLPMMDCERNFPEKRVIPLLVPREYIVPPPELGVFTKIKDSSKEVKGLFCPQGKAFAMNQQIKCQEFSAKMQGKISKNLKSSTIKEKEGVRSQPSSTPCRVQVGLEVGYKPAPRANEPPV